jgi:hypothetical protein
VQQDRADPVAVVTHYLEWLAAANNEGERDERLGRGFLTVWVDGSPWCLSLEEHGWMARPVHEWPNGELVTDDIDGPLRRIGDTELTPEEIIDLLRVAVRGRR